MPLECAIELNIVWSRYQVILFSHSLDFTSLCVCEGSVKTSVWKNMKSWQVDEATHGFYWLAVCFVEHVIFVDSKINSTFFLPNYNLFYPALWVLQITFHKISRLHIIHIHQWKYSSNIHDRQSDVLLPPGLSSLIGKVIEVVRTLHVRVTFSMAWVCVTPIIWMGDSYVHGKSFSVWPKFQFCSVLTQPMIHWTSSWLNSNSYKYTHIQLRKSSVKRFGLFQAEPKFC